MKRNPIFSAIFILLLAADQVSKFFIIKYLNLGSFRKVTQFLTLTYLRNRGHRYGSEVIQILLEIILPCIVIVLVLITLVKKSNYTSIQRAAMWAILAGGVGNLLDILLKNGETIVFIHINIYPKLPVFNIGHFTVAISSVIMLISLIIQSRRRYE